MDQFHSRPDDSHASRRGTKKLVFKDLLHRINGKSPRILITVILLGCLVTILMLAPLRIPQYIGTIDFRPYWSSSYLFSRGQDFGDLDLLDRIERDLTGWTESYTMAAWFSPVGNLALFAITYLPFQLAARCWLFANIVMVFISSLLLGGKSSKIAWILLFSAFVFPPVLVSLIFGQVNFLGLLGIACYLSFSSTNKHFAAGISLVLTLIKPQLVILALPILVLDIIYHRQWKTVLGFLIGIGACLFGLFAINPGWPASFWKVLTSGLMTWRATPTLNGLLVVLGEYHLGKWLWLVVLLVGCWIWWKLGRHWSQRLLIDVMIISGFIVSPIGWSYDQLMLLIPMASILDWIDRGSIRKLDSRLIIFMLIIINLVIFIERTFAVNDVWFFWVPMVFLAIYIYARRKAQIMMDFEDEQIIRASF